MSKTPKLTPEERAEAAILYERLSGDGDALERFIYYFAVSIRAKLERELAALREQLAIETSNGEYWAKAYAKWVTTDLAARRLIEVNEQLAERDAEIAALKGHAEAMAGEIRTAFWGGNPSTALASYRAAYPKED